MALHDLPLEPRTLHGVVDRSLPAAIEIDDGDAVRLRTLDAMWCDGKPTAWPWKPIAHRDARLGHALSGPIAVRGARPGDVLEVAIDTLVPGDWGWTYVWLDRAQQQRLRLDTDGRHGTTWTIDPASMSARDDRDGRRVPLRPFLGWMGLATESPGTLPTAPPRRVGGNLDCRELVAGTALLLPVEVAGGLFSCGDGHALQGDGEVCGTALECPMSEVRLTFRLHRRQPIVAPRARLERAWLAMGFGDTLDDAAALAMQNALDLLVEHHALPREEAMLRLSLHGDLRITQIVNGSVGVHLLVPDGSAGRE